MCNLGMKAHLVQGAQSVAPQGLKGIMGFRTGIVGLPNVGKSTLFNALTSAGAARAANFPFCTIEANAGEAAVPDPRLHEVARIAKSREAVPARLKFVDIAGLVRGASKGEGLGNQFLGTIREVDAIAHVVRCFRDDDVVHVDGGINPVGDIETVETELMLADIESIERRIERLAKKVKGGDPEALEHVGLLRRALPFLEQGQPARMVEIAEGELQAWRQIRLLTAKPVLYVCNVDEDSAASGNEHSDRVAEIAKRTGAGHVICSAAIEEQIGQFEQEEASEFFAELGLQESGLSRMIRAGYDLLGLMTFFSAGIREAHAWTVPRGTSALDAAGEIHGDFRRGFIRAETASFEDYVRYGGEAGAREAGRLRSEGRDYIVQDGDVLRILFNV